MKRKSRWISWFSRAAVRFHLYFHARSFQRHEEPGNSQQDAMTAVAKHLNRRKEKRNNAASFSFQIFLYSSCLQIFVIVLRIRALNLKSLKSSQAAVKCSNFHRDARKVIYVHKSAWKASTWCPAAVSASKVTRIFKEKSDSSAFRLDVKPSFRDLSDHDWF